MIKGVFVNGCWIVEPCRVKEEIQNFFMRRFEESEWERSKLDGVNFRSIGQHHNNFLVARFAENEVRDAVWECGSEKSPGLDGLNFKFIKEFWDDIKSDLLRLDEFHANGVFPKGGNASFLALIPKVHGPQSLNEYRPISLIGSVHKIVAKVLSRRLKKVMPTIIDERQTAFVEGKHMLHSVLIANKVVNEAKRQNKSCLVFKVDYEMVYDFVCWEFLLYMMRRMGFCPKWIRWIEGCLKSTSISISLFSGCR